MWKNINLIQMYTVIVWKVVQYFFKVIQHTVDFYPYDLPHQPLLNVIFVTRYKSYADPFYKDTYILILNEPLYYRKTLNH